MVLSIWFPELIGINILIKTIFFLGSNGSVGNINKKKKKLNIFGFLDT